MRLTATVLCEHQALLIDVGYDCRYRELSNQHAIRLLQCSVETAVAKSKYKRSVLHVNILWNPGKNNNKKSQAETEREREKKKVKHILFVIYLSSFFSYLLLSSLQMILFIHFYRNVLWFDLKESRKCSIVQERQGQAMQRDRRQTRRLVTLHDVMS